MVHAEQAATGESGLEFGLTGTQEARGLQKGERDERAMASKLIGQGLTPGGPPIAQLEFYPNDLAVSNGHDVRDASGDIDFRAD